jgi:hypothetical protein
MTKRYFYRTPFVEKTREVTLDEYRRAYTKEFMGDDVTRVLESIATKESPACGTTRIFWVEEE